MDIYIVSHYYDNGESYEDYREYENHYHFSTLKKAVSFYWKKVTSDYEGMFVLSVKTLDTQEERKLEESAYLKCSSWYSCQEDYPPYDPEYDCCDTGYTGPDPYNSIEEYWKWEDECGCCPDDDIPEEEDKAWFEYVTTPGTNYQEWEAVNKEIEERKQQIQIESLNEMLEELLTI